MFGSDADVQQSIVDTSKAFGILSPYTSMLVVRDERFAEARHRRHQPRPPRRRSRRQGYAQSAAGDRAFASTILSRCSAPRARPIRAEAAARAPSACPACCCRSPCSSAGSGPAGGRSPTSDSAASASSPVASPTEGDPCQAWWRGHAQAKCVPRAPSTAAACPRAGPRPDPGGGPPPPLRGGGTEAHRPSTHAGGPSFRGSRSD